MSEIDSTSLMGIIQTVLICYMQNIVRPRINCVLCAPDKRLRVFRGGVGLIGVNIGGEFMGWLNEGHMRKQLRSAGNFTDYLKRKLKLEEVNV